MRVVYEGPVEVRWDVKREGYVASAVIGGHFVWAFHVLADRAEKDLRADALAVAAKANQ